MNFNECVVAYDIENNKDRKKMFDGLKDIGLRPIQKSVFWGKISIAEERAVRRLFDEFLEQGDRAFVIRSNLYEAVSERSVGYRSSDFVSNKNYDYV